MRRITLWVLSTITVLVLLFSYRTSTSSAATTSLASGALSANGSDKAAAANAAGSSTPTSTPTPQASSHSSSSSSSSSSSTPSSSSSSSSKATTSSSKVYTGNAIDTRYGPVQVQIKVSGGKIVAAGVSQVPWNDRRDQEINSYAVPVLNSEAVSANSSSIDMVSGATFTSDGYIQSLQSAIDQAGL